MPAMRSAHGIEGLNQSHMSHDVFISHARKDKGIADAICEKLESGQVRCWIADRDISAGEDWTEVTRNAIGSSRVMVLVLSENANAAPHIEREIAHAFYTGRMIIPLRVTDTLPRRDFLFYLGNVRCFDAFSPPAEHHLEAFTASINGMVRGPTANSATVPPDRQNTETKKFHFSDSWIGALQASHYRTLELLKRAAIATALIGIGLLLWFGPWQTKEEIPLAQENPPAPLSGPGTAPDPRAQVSTDTAASKPTYTYSRFGLWVAPKNQTTTSNQPPADPSTSSVSQPSTAAASGASDPDQKEAAGAKSVEDLEGASVNRPRLTSRQEVHRRKGRPKHHTRKVASSDESLVAHIKRRLQSVRRKVVEGNR
jgi:TIR domain